MLGVSDKRGGWRRSDLLWLKGGFWLVVSCCFLTPSLLAKDTHPQTPVILISIDTLRADHLGAYGYRKIRTPNIDSFAEGGTLFTGAQSQIPLTLPSHTSLFTSTYPFENHIEENGERVPAGMMTVASVLRSQGYHTAAFVGSVMLDRRMGLDQGFELYDSPFNVFEGATENPYSVRVRRDAVWVVHAALQWLDTQHGQPVFVFVHLFDLHTPYNTSGAEAQQSAAAIPAIAGYDTQLAHVDQVLGKFREALKQSGWWDRSLVVLLSDHGEGLGDHGESSHGYFIYQSTLWVPLIFHWPSGALEYAPRASESVGLIDVAPTILDFLQIPAPSSFRGESLLGMTQPDKNGGGHSVYSESVYAADAFHWAALRALRLGAYKYIDAPRPELYDLQDDPSEQRNIFGKTSEEGLDLRRQLGSLLDRFAAPALPSSGEPSPQVRALLGDLGYVTGGPRPNSPGLGPDPKDRLPEFNLYEKALASLYSGHAEAAIVMLRQLLAADPQNTSARYYLGESYLRSRKPEDALAAWNAAVHYDPEYVPAYEAIGSLLVEQKQYSRARAPLEQALAISPGDYTAQFELGLAEEHLGLIPEAHEHLKAACQVAPDSSCERELRALEQKSSGP